ncbi:hypothetical protein ASC58_09860 [Phycicoccus sp. Root101]|nr:hypothetical protein ASC58_09860 [Phycicoccus sp. Root101]
MTKSPASASSPESDQLRSNLTRTEIQRSGSSIPGREIVQVLTQIPEGVQSGWHYHPGEEVGYILAGTVEMHVKGREPVILAAGDGFLIPPRTPHNAKDVGPGTGQMLSVYLVDPTEPVSTLVDERSDEHSAWNG